MMFRQAGHCEVAVRQQHVFGLALNLRNVVAVFPEPCRELRRPMHWMHEELCYARFMQVLGLTT
jgi:hypothetical protein